MSADLGPESNSWRFSSDDADVVFDLTRSMDGNTNGLQIKVSTGATIKTDPARCALVIIDMQNYFLSEALGRSRGQGHEASENLIKHAIPAARKAGMQIIWLSWGLTDEDMLSMPAAVKRCFGFPACDAKGQTVLLDRHGTVRTDRGFAGLGGEIGNVIVPEHERVEDEKDQIDAGRVLFRDTWNAEIYGPLKEHCKSGDQRITKNRISGLWDYETPMSKYLQQNGFTTLFFAGVNTDQCVGSTLSDAFSYGYDCVLLKDGCGTSSPAFATQAWEFNVENGFGFVTTCKDLYDAAMR